jgi:hypothetical protein
MVEIDRSTCDKIDAKKHLLARVSFNPSVCFLQGSCEEQVRVISILAERTCVVLLLPSLCFLWWFENMNRGILSYFLPIDIFTDRL